MTNDDSAVREVDQAVAEERQFAFFKTQGPRLILVASLIVLAVAGWQFWSHWRAAKSADASLTFASAAKTLASSPEDGREAMKALAEDAPAGYAALADMQLAASLAGSGDRAGAVAAYARVYGSGGAPKRLRELARLRAALLSLADGRDAVLRELGALTEEDSEFGYYARELSAVAALEAKDYEGSYEMFARAAADPQAPAPIRQRAEELAALASAGKAGVNLLGQARVKDLLKALGESEKTAPEDKAPEDKAATGEAGAQAGASAGDGDADGNE